MMQPARTTDAEFTESELRYLMDRSLARLAFVCGDMKAHIMPVLFEFDGQNFYLSGWNLKYSQQFQDIPERTTVTLLVDDVVHPTRWTPRGIEIVGFAEAREDDGYYYVLVKPVNKTSWGL